jgi:class 3 adenylate cyclase
VLVSRTVRDLVVGPKITFEDRGSHALKGIEGDWNLLAVPAHDTPAWKIKRTRAVGGRR